MIVFDQLLQRVAAITAGNKGVSNIALRRREACHTRQISRGHRIAVARIICPGIGDGHGCR